jgi:hypothetical protein
MTEATLCLSGPVSEAKYSRKSIYQVLAGAGRADRRMATRALQDYQPEHIARIVEPLQVAIEIATELIEREWRLVCKLSAALLQYERLSADEVLQVIGPRAPVR